MRLLIPLLLIMAALASCDSPENAEMRGETPPPASDSLTVFLVVLDEDATARREIGCNDRLVPYTVSPPGVGEDPVRASLRALVALHDPPAPYTNALSGSTLEVESVWLEGQRAEVHLSGDLVVYGVCHIPRIEWQLKETVRTQSGADTVNVYVNGRALEEMFDVRG